MLPGGKTEPLVTELPKYSSDISPDGGWLVASDGNYPKLGLWNLAERKFILNLEGSTVSRRNIKFAGENLVVMDVTPVGGQPPRALGCWDRKTGILLARLPLTRPDEFVEGIFTAPNGSFAVLRIKHNPAPTGNEPNLLQIWRLPKPGQVHGPVKPPTAAPAKAETPDAQKQVWRDALAEAPLKEVTATADHTDKGYLLPNGKHYRFPAQPLQDGALRVRATVTPGRSVELCFFMGGAGGSHFRLRSAPDSRQQHLNYIPKPGADLTLARTAVLPADGLPYDLLFARVAGKLWVTLNGEVIMHAAAPDATTPGQFGIDCLLDSSVHLLNADYLPLDGLPEAEALLAEHRVLPGLEGREHLRGEGLVDLVEVEVLQREAVALLVLVKELDLHLRHVHAGGAIAPASLATHAQVERGAHRLRGKIRTELPG